MENNRFLEKFKDKNESELREIIKRAEQSDPKAIIAAKHILENFSDFNKKSKVEKVIVDPIFKEKSFFKNKWIYIVFIGYSLLASLSVIFTYNLPQAYIFISWSIVNLLIFIVLISKHKDTLHYLKILSMISIGFILFRYIDTYLIHSELNKEFKIENKDFKFIAIYIGIIFAGDYFIETRNVQINK
tara:strand:- start:269 stop:829 length:561 start_codon:yes stop_codon:yes gene_type:complete